MTDERRQIVQVDTAQIRELIERRRAGGNLGTWIANDTLEAILLELDTLRRWQDSTAGSTSKRKQDALQAKAAVNYRRSQRRNSS